MKYGRFYNSVVRLVFKGGTKKVTVSEGRIFFEELEWRIVLFRRAFKYALKIRSGEPVLLQPHGHKLKNGTHLKSIKLY